MKIKYILVDELPCSCKLCGFWRKGICIINGISRPVPGGENCPLIDDIDSEHHEVDLWLRSY